MKENKKWALWVTGGFYGVLLIIMMVTYVVDPYFHFHKPSDSISYKLDEYNYINDGITRHFDFDAFITGTSLTECTRVADINDIFGVNAVRLTFLGEGNKRIDYNTQKCLEMHDIKTVIRGLDTMYFISDKDYDHYDYYPEYLYDDDWTNDTEYLLNIDVLNQETIPEIIRTLRGIPHAEFDQIADINERGSKEGVLAKYTRNDYLGQSLTQEDYDEYIKLLTENMEQNVISTIRDYPDTTFYIFFPPYSILYFDELHQAGDDILKRRIVLEKQAIEMLLECSNVKLFSFFNNFDMITNLDNYRDDCHYVALFNKQILEWMAAGDYQLTKDNYEQYIDEITDFYMNYDYDSVF